MTFRHTPLLSFEPPLSNTSISALPQLPWASPNLPARANPPFGRDHPSHHLLRLPHLSAPEFPQLGFILQAISLLRPHRSVSAKRTPTKGFSRQPASSTPWWRVLFPTQALTVPGSEKWSDSCRASKPGRSASLLITFHFK